MSSEEFSLHQAYWQVEPSGPHGDVQRWASLMSAVVNGPRVRKSKRPFDAADFWPPDAWAAEPGEVRMVTKPKPGKTGKAPPMAPDLSHMRGMRVNNSKRR
jgi:hypothetical protein